MEKGMRKLMVPLALMLAVSLTAPIGVSAKEDSGRSASLEQLKDAKKSLENGLEKKADDKSGKGGDDKGKDDKGKDDKGGVK